MKIVSIHIYPIKSLGGISLQSSKLLERGLEFDRRWMLVDSAGVFITQRQIPKLALFKLSLLQEHLLVHSGIDNKSVQVSFNCDGEWIEVRVWDDTVKVQEVAAETSQWFSNQLNQEVKLVYMHESSTRFIDKDFASNNETVSFADGYPILMANTSSLEDVNSRLKNKVKIARFRPNIVVKGDTPFEEEQWRKISLGTSKIEVVKKCARCVMVNINPVSAVKETEVLQVLSTYRKVDNKVYFGVNALVQKTGVIKVGDTLQF